MLNVIGTLVLYVAYAVAVTGAIAIVPWWIGCALFYDRTDHPGALWRGGCSVLFLGGLVGFVFTRFVFV